MRLVAVNKWNWKGLRDAFNFWSDLVWQSPCSFQTVTIVLQSGLERSVLKPPITMIFGTWHDQSPRSSCRQARRRAVRSSRTGWEGYCDICIGLPLPPNLGLVALSLLSGTPLCATCQINIATIQTHCTKNVTTTTLNQESGSKLVSLWKLLL